MVLAESRQLCSKAIPNIRSLDIDQINKSMFGALQKAMQKIEDLEKRIEAVENLRAIWKA